MYNCLWVIIARPFIISTHKHTHIVICAHTSRARVGRACARLAFSGGSCASLRTAACRSPPRGSPCHWRPTLKVQSVCGSCKKSLSPDQWQSNTLWQVIYEVVVEHTGLPWLMWALWKAPYCGTPQRTRLSLVGVAVPGQYASTQWDVPQYLGSSACSLRFCAR